MIRTAQTIPIYATDQINSNTIVQIGAYSAEKQAWKVTVPTVVTASLSKFLVTTCELYSPSYMGFGQYGDGLYTIKYSGSEEIKINDGLNCKAEKDADGVFRILHYDSSSKFAICRPLYFEGIKRAFCKADAGEGLTLICMFGDEYDADGEDITIKFNVIGGENLNTAVPRLEKEDMILVTQFGTDWYCIGLFMGTEACDCYQGEPS